MVDARAQGDGIRLAPSLTSIGATVAHNVDVLGQVAFVGLALVSGNHQRAVFGCNDCWDAGIGGAVIARPINHSASQSVVSALRSRLATNSQNNRQQCGKGKDFFHSGSFLVYYIADKTNNNSAHTQLFPIFAPQLCQTRLL